MRHCDTLLHAACIVTQDEQRRIIENASLAIDKGLIADLRPLPNCYSAGKPMKPYTMKVSWCCRG